MAGLDFRYVAGMESDTESIEFDVVSQVDRAQALAMLVSQEPVAERAGRVATIVTALRQRDVSEATLVGVWRDGQLMGVAWGQVLPGKTVLLWPPRVTPDENEVIGDELLGFLDKRLLAAGIRMSQVVLSHREHPDASRLERAGYTHAADLLYLVSELDRNDATPVECELEFEPYTLANHSRLATLVERTYVGTLDIPALDGVRDIEDVLAGYEQTGEFSPDRWFFVRYGNEDVGCLLLTDHPLQQQWELVYLGIVPEARGNGWGIKAARFAQRLAKDADRRRIILAVDATNDPAVSAYTKAGFFELLRRSVFLKIFR